MGACCSNPSAKNRKKEHGKVAPDKKPLRSTPPNGASEEHSLSSNDSRTGRQHGEYDESVSYSESMSMSNARGGRDKSKTIVTDFGFAIGIELDDIASFLEDIRRTDKKREQSKDASKKRKMDGMDRIWYGCVGSSSKNKEQIEEIMTPSQLNRLLYKLTYVTLNTFQKSKKLSKSSIKAKPDKRAVEQALIPMKRAILLLKYNKQVHRGDPELNKNVVITRTEFKEEFSKYLRKASEFMQEQENAM